MLADQDGSHAGVFRRLDVFVQEEDSFKLWVVLRLIEEVITVIVEANKV